MGFAWRPDNGDAQGDLHRDRQRASRRYYPSVSARAVLRSPAGRHALSHGQRRALSHIDPAVSPEDRDYSGAGRGAHAARPAKVPRRPSGWSGPERWRRWA